MFTVYMHTCPNGKRYVGMTSKDVEERWSFGYCNNLEFQKDINRYGWFSIEHEILEICETQEEAEEKEKYYISKYNTTNPEFGYNRHPGGNWHPCPKGYKRSPEAVKNITQAQRDKYKNGYAPIWINNGIEEKSISKNIFGEYIIPDGWVKGRLNLKNTYMNKNGQNIKIEESDIQKYLEKGWKLGRDVPNLKKSRQQYVWILDSDKKFESATSLAKYLQESEGSKIVGSTITSLYNKGFKTSKIYAYLDSRITRESL